MLENAQQKGKEREKAKIISKEISAKVFRGIPTKAKAREAERAS